MKRAMKEGSYAIRLLKAEEIDSDFADDPKARWLLGQATTLGLHTLLAHADDGLIWGTVNDRQLKLSGQVFPKQFPALRSMTLQQLRLFGERAEVLIWRDGDSWRGRVLEDAPISEPRCFDEAQIQVGDHAEDSRDGFTVVAEGQEGLRHAAPLDKIPFEPADNRDRHHPLRLTVRHYLDRIEEDGTLVIAHSRLVRLSAEAAKQEAPHG
jgi:CRISPR-associated protein (TIGR03984 family)